MVQPSTKVTVRITTYAVTYKLKGKARFIIPFYFIYSSLLQKGFRQTYLSWIVENLVLHLLMNCFRTKMNFNIMAPTWNL